MARNADGKPAKSVHTVEWDGQTAGAIQLATIGLFSKASYETRDYSYVKTILNCSAY